MYRAIARAVVSTGARPNTITIHGRDYLLAWVGAYAAHLVAQAGSGAPCRPILAHAGAVLNPRYEPGPLTDAAWSLRTLCGRDEWFMCPTEAGRAFESMWNGREEEVLVPTCKACLRILDREFARPVPDERLAWNVIRVVEELEQWGSVHIHGVPAEQAELLRTSVRAQARKRGWKFHSMAADGQLIASCENALSPERREFVIRDSMQPSPPRVPWSPSPMERWRSPTEA